MSSIRVVPAGSSTTANRLLRTCLTLALAVFAFTAAASAQATNNGALLITVVDQNDAVIPGASISVTNAATGAMRDAVSGSEGTATFPALSLTGDYKVTVSKNGF